MTTVDQAKIMAKSLRSSMAARGVELTHSAALEAVAAQLGFADWNTAAARLVPADGIRFLRTIPILRSFDEAKAREFYLDFLSFTVGFEHRFHPGAPLYMEVERAGMKLHLSEHHGDASPGATVFVWMQGIRDFHAELLGRNYKNNRPGLENAPWGDEVTVHDPFGNRIRFCESRD